MYIKPSLNLVDKQSQEEKNRSKEDQSYEEKLYYNFLFLKNFTSKLLLFIKFVHLLETKKKMNRGGTQ